MTPALVLAVVAAGLGAVAIVDLAAAVATLRGRERGGPATRGGSVALLARLGRRIGAALAPPAGLGRRIEAAGSPGGLDAGDLMAIKGGSALLGLALAGPAALVLPGRLPIVALVGLPLAGFVAPDLWLRRRIATRARTMEIELPDVLDLLRVAVEAGLPLGRALGEVGDRHTGLLASEWRLGAAELALGLPRVQVLESLVRRCPVPAVAQLVATLTRAERHGVPLAEPLAAQATEVRAARARRVRDAAARAAPKIQLVVALLLVPSVLLLVAAALVASMMAG